MKHQKRRCFHSAFHILKIDYAALEALFSANSFILEMM